jgi:hypothetical protein
MMHGCDAKKPAPELLRAQKNLEKAARPEAGLCRRLWQHLRVVMTHPTTPVCKESRNIAIFWQKNFTGMVSSALVVSSLFILFGMAWYDLVEKTKKGPEGDAAGRFGFSVSWVSSLNLVYSV